MNRKLDFLINEMNDTKHTRLNELTVLEQAVDGLKKENLKVMKENIDLRERDKYLSLIIYVRFKRKIKGSRAGNKKSDHCN